ncbi:hypothetical protein L596_004586 [Steinernema carpocapsae]|uniref:Uncharacterized protein n=1 Tax=Steinernema carpocapsae TaxID=34508 RepID=A0A4U8UWD7_STECR|nr:hypothetical protein L596_004586 [Steinernema carpocapsae]
MLLAHPAKVAGRCAVRELSASATKVQESTTSINADDFQLFTGPKVVAPSFELQRWASTGISQFIYGNFVEKTYSKTGFLNGANQAIDLAALHIRTKNWERLRAFMTKKCVERIKNAVETIPSDLLEKRLQFSYGKGNVVHSFLHSTIVSGEKVFGLNETGGGYFFNGTIVSFINVSGEPLYAMSLRKLAQNKGKIVVANVSIARYIKPPGPWYITNINFFDYPKDA